MHKVIVPFPLAIEPRQVEQQLEEAVRQNSGHQVKVRFLDSQPDGNRYEITSEHIGGMYHVGFAAGNILIEHQQKVKTD